MKKLSLYSVAALAVLAFAPVAAAADASTVAIVNIQHVMQDSNAGQNVREQLENKQKTFQADLSKREERLQKDKQELDKQKNVLSKNAFGEKVDAFRKNETEYQKEYQYKKAMFETAIQHSQDDVLKVVIGIIADIAKEKNITAVIPSSAILYADPKLDISDEVLKRLNEKLPKLDVKFEAPAPAPDKK